MPIFVKLRKFHKHLAKTFFHVIVYSDYNKNLKKI
jgi:hypothetical protein